MTPKEFKKTYWPDIAASCEETGLNPLFVAAQAALETGWGKSAIVALVCGLSLWTAMPVVALAALGLAHLVAKVRAVKLSRGEAVAYAVGNLATWLLLVAGYLVK